MASRIRRIFLGLLPILVLVAFAGCGTQEDQVLGPAGDDSCVKADAWLWAFDSDQDSLRIYDTATGLLEATFFAQPHSFLHEVQAGPAAEPTVWMGSGGIGYPFSAGFESHGDHAHMVRPQNLDRVITGSGNTHLTSDPSGDFVCWANDGDATFTVVDVTTRVPVTINHGSPHSGSLLAGGRVLATHMNEKWARIIEVESGDILATVTIDTLAHGEAYYSAADQAFVPCLHGVSVVDFTQQDFLELIPYPDTGRVNFLYYRHGSSKALAPVKLDSGTASSVWILDLTARSMSAVILPGSALAWNRSGGNISLSSDGSRALLTDLETAKAYLVDVDHGTTETLEISASDMACALDFSGDKLWLLDKVSGQIHYRYRTETAWQEGSGFSVSAGSDWIFITNLDPAVEIIREY